jgi:hypothetical protein
MKTRAQGFSQTSLPDLAEDLPGQTAEAADCERLSNQRAQVAAIMSDGQWHTLPGLATELRRRFGRRYAETSISARLRGLRVKDVRDVERARVHPRSGLYQYRLVTHTGKQAAA